MSENHKAKGESTFYNENDLTIHIDYVHYNPEKHGSVKGVSAWLDGDKSPDWCCGGIKGDPTLRLIGVK